ncbi:MAG: hypothetical protein KAJ58_01065 [Candidatus Pacebacteria bacterium]|nr:hypothetical protein [Candidatus Paceibacterota bacterium]
MKSIKNFFGKEKTKDKAFRWSSISSKSQKKIIRNAASGSNKLQRDLYNKAKLLS